VTSDLEIAVAAARAGASVVRDAFGTGVRPEFKGAVDPVTAVDHSAEAAILAVIGDRRPADATLSEESGGVGWDGPRVWIADPLDGTVNFVHGLPHVAVSVALWDRGEPVVGVVIDVIRGEEFTAVAGAGAFCDGSPISVSRETDMARSLVVTGFPYDRNRRAEVYATVLGRVLALVQGIRRTGSAALDICYVACGRFDAYWEYGLAAWDVAAGMLILTEAGGTVTGFGGAPYRPGAGGLVASNGAVHRPLVDAVGVGS
jgi:myo-inositol-1(or 4)-monophosphatase